jgi:hypothetical protein
MNLSYEPPPIDVYYDHVVRHLEDELTQEQIAQEARFRYEVDRVRLRQAEDPEAVLATILAELEADA